MFLNKDLEGTIRLATSADGGALAALHEALFPKGWSRETFETYCGSEQHLVLKAESGDGRLCGLLAMQIILDEGEILTLGVARDWHRRGLGEALLKTAFAELVSIGIHYIYLDVAESNLAARRLYDKLGFAIIGRREGYYTHQEPPEAALLMRRELRG